MGNTFGNVDTIGETFNYLYLERILTFIMSEFLHAISLTI